MANGKNVEQGTHSELLQNETGAYSALVRLQLEAGEGGGAEKKKGESGGTAGGPSFSSVSASASPGSSPAGVVAIYDAAAADEASSAASASASASAARAAEGAGAAAAASAAAERAAASDAAPERSLGWRRLWELSKEDSASILVGVLGSAALGELFSFSFF